MIQPKIYKVFITELKSFNYIIYHKSYSTFYLVYIGDVNERGINDDDRLISIPESIKRQKIIEFSQWERKVYNTTCTPVAVA